MNTEAGEPNSTYASRGGLPGGIADKLREIVGKKGGRTAVSDLARNRGVTALAGGFVPNFAREKKIAMMDRWYSTSAPKRGSRKRNGVQPMVHSMAIEPNMGMYNPKTTNVLVSDSKSRFNETLTHEEFGHAMFAKLKKTKGFSERMQGPLQAIKGDSTYRRALSDRSPLYDYHKNSPAEGVLDEAFAQSIGSRFDKNYAPGKDKQMDIFRGLTSSLITPRMEQHIRKYLEKNGDRLYDSLSKTKLPANKAKVKFSEMAAGFVPNFLDVSLLKPYREYLKKLKEGQYEVKDLNPKDRSAEEFQSQRGIEQGYEVRGQYSHKTGIMSMDKNFMKTGAMEEKSKTVAHEGIHGIVAEMRKNQIAKREKALAEKTKVLHSPWALLEEKDAATKKFEEMKSQPLIKDQLYSLSENFSNFPESEKNKLSTVRRMSGNYDQRMTMEEALADGTADMPGERDVLGKALGLSGKKIGTIGKMSRSLREAAAEGIKRKESSGGLMARLKSFMGGASRGFVPNFAAKLKTQISHIRSITDGDTINAHVAIPQNLGLRLADVDAAEHDQTFGPEATAEMAKAYKNDDPSKGKLLKNISQDESAAFGRGSFTDDALGRQLVSKGLGVPDLRYTAAYQDLTETARKNKAGIWSVKNHPKALQYDKQIGYLKDNKVERDEFGKVKNIKANKNAFAELSYEGSRGAFGEQKKIKEANEKIKTDYSVAFGFVPNFNALKDAVGREESGLRSRGINPSGKIYFGTHPSLPNGGIANKVDEPRGIAQGVSRAMTEGRNPRTYGTSGGFVPNFAEDDNSNSGIVALTSAMLGSISAIRQNGLEVRQGALAARANTDTMRIANNNSEKAAKYAGMSIQQLQQRQNRVRNQTDKDNLGALIATRQSQEKLQSEATPSTRRTVTGGLLATVPNAIAGSMKSGPEKAGMEVLGEASSLASTALMTIPGLYGKIAAGAIILAGAIRANYIANISLGEKGKALAEVMKEQQKNFETGGQEVIKAHQTYADALYNTSISSEMVGKLSQEIAVAMEKIPASLRRDFESRIKLASSQEEKTRIFNEMNQKLIKDQEVTDNLAQSSSKSEGIGQSIRDALAGSKNRYQNTEFVNTTPADQIRQKKALDKDVFSVTASATDSESKRKKYETLVDPSSQSKNVGDFRNQLSNLVPPEAKAMIMGLSDAEIALYQARMRQIEATRKQSEMISEVSKKYIDAERERSKQAQAEINLVRDRSNSLKKLADAFSTMGIGFANAVKVGKIDSQTKSFGSFAGNEKRSTGLQTQAIIDAQNQKVQADSGAMQQLSNSNSQVFKDLLSKGTSGPGAPGSESSADSLTDNQRKANLAIQQAMSTTDTTKGTPKEVIQKIKDEALKNAKGDPGAQKEINDKLQGSGGKELEMKLEENNVLAAQQLKVNEDAKQEQIKTGIALAKVEQNSKAFGGIENFLDKGKTREDNSTFRKALRASGSGNQERAGRGSMQLILSAQKDLGGALSTKNAGALQETAISARASQIRREATKRISSINKSNIPQPQKRALIGAYQEARGNSREIARTQVEEAAKLERAPLEQLKRLDTIAQGFSALNNALVNSGIVLKRIDDPNFFTNASEGASKGNKDANARIKVLAAEEGKKKDAATRVSSQGNDVLRSTEFTAGAKKIREGSLPKEAQNELIRKLLNETLTSKLTEGGKQPLSNEDSKAITDYSANADISKFDPKINENTNLANEQMENVLAINGNTSALDYLSDMLMNLTGILAPLNAVTQGIGNISRFAGSLAGGSSFSDAVTAGGTQPQRPTRAGRPQGPPAVVGFAEGGPVTTSNGISIPTRSNGDNILSTLQTGEIVIPRKGVAAYLDRMKVPGFAEGTPSLEESWGMQKRVGGPERVWQFRDDVRELLPRGSDLGFRVEDSKAKLEARLAFQNSVPHPISEAAPKPTSLLPASAQPPPAAAAPGPASFASRSESVNGVRTSSSDGIIHNTESRNSVRPAPSEIRSGRPGTGLNFSPREVVNRVTSSVSGAGIPGATSVTPSTTSSSGSTSSKSRFFFDTPAPEPTPGGARKILADELREMRKVTKEVDNYRFRMDEKAKLGESPSQKEVIKHRENVDRLRNLREGFHDRVATGEIKPNHAERIVRNFPRTHDERSRLSAARERALPKPATPPTASSAGIPGVTSETSSTAKGIEGAKPTTLSTTAPKPTSLLPASAQPPTPLRPAVAGDNISAFQKSADTARQARANGMLPAGANAAETAALKAKYPMDYLRPSSAPGGTQMHLGSDGQWRPVADQAYKTPTPTPSPSTRMNPYENFGQQQRRQQKSLPTQRSLTGQTFQDFRNESLNQTPEQRKSMLRARVESGNFVDRNVARAKLLAEKFKSPKPADIFGRDLPARYAEMRVPKPLQGPGLPGTPIKIDQANVRAPQVKQPTQIDFKGKQVNYGPAATQPKAPLKLVPRQPTSPPVSQPTSPPVSQLNAKPAPSMWSKSYQLPKGVSDLLSKAKNVTGLNIGGGLGNSPILQKAGGFLKNNSGKLGLLGIGAGAYHGAQGAEAKGFSKAQGAFIGGVTGDLETGLLKGRDGETLSARGKVSEIGEGFSGLLDQEKTPIERLKSAGGAGLNVLSFLDPKQVLSMLGEAYDVKQDSTTGMTMGFMGDVLRGAGAGAAVGGPWGAAVGAIAAGVASATKIENYVPEEIQKETQRGDASMGMLKGMTKEEKKKYSEFRKGNKDKIEKDMLTPNDQMDLFKNSPEGKAVIERLDKAKNSGQNGQGEQGGQGGDPSDPFEKIMARYKARGTKISDKTKNQMKFNIEQGTVSAESYMQHANTGKLDERETKRQKSEKGAATSGNAEKLWRSQADAAYNEGDEETGARLTAHADRNRDQKEQYEKDLKDSGGSITTAPPNTFDRNKAVDSNVNRQDPDNPNVNSGQVNFAVNVASANGQNPQAASVNFNPAQFEEFRTIVMQKFVDYSSQFDGVNNALRAIDGKSTIPTKATA
jgi:endonuclease YncB( thermonuclease family)